MSVALAAAALSAGPTSAASDNASCVGQFSTFFAQQGLRDDVAQRLRPQRAPGGKEHVYSQVAELHGSLQECIDQTS